VSRKFLQRRGALDERAATDSAAMCDSFDIKLIG